MSLPNVGVRAGRGKRGVDETGRRRGLVKDLFFKEGVTKPVRIIELLKERFGIVVDRQTVYKDIRSLGSFSDDDFRSFSGDVLNVLRGNIRDLQRLVVEEVDVGKKVLLMKALSRLCLDEQSLAGGVLLQGRDLRGGGRRVGGSVVFGEPVVDGVVESVSEDVDESGSESVDKDKDESEDVDESGSESEDEDVVEGK